MNLSCRTIDFGSGGVGVILMRVRAAGILFDLSCIFVCYRQHVQLLSLDYLFVSHAQVRVSPRRPRSLVADKGYPILYDFSVFVVVFV